MPARSSEVRRQPVSPNTIWTSPMPSASRPPFEPVPTGYAADASQKAGRRRAGATTVGEESANDDKNAEPVQLRVPADFDRLPVVRAVTRTLAVLGDFILDEIADITLAADEVCTQLIASALTVSDLRCTFTAEHRLLITIGARLGRPGVPAREGIEWHVLDTLTDSLSVSESTTDTNPTGRDVAVELVKHRSDRNRVSPTAAVANRA